MTNNNWIMTNNNWIMTNNFTRIWLTGRAFLKNNLSRSSQFLLRNWSGNHGSVKVWRGLQQKGFRWNKFCFKCHLILGNSKVCNLYTLSIRNRRQDTEPLNGWIVKRPNKPSEYWSGIQMPFKFWTHSGLVFWLRHLPAIFTIRPNTKYMSRKVSVLAKTDVVAMSQKV